MENFSAPDCDCGADARGIGAPMDFFASGADVEQPVVLMIHPAIARPVLTAV